MSIDGIGKPGSPGGPGPIGSAAGVGAPSSSFEVDPTKPVADVSDTDLARLDRGELTLDQYLDRRVEQAVEHLAGKMSPEQLDFVRHTLRDQLSTDPVLVEMIRRATGQDVSSAR